MPDNNPPPLVTPARVVAAVCVVAPVVATLWTPFYNTNTPTAGGFPFFYWYQLLWVVITAVLMIVAYLAIRYDERARKPFRQAVRQAGESDPADGEDQS